jgi:hypothetical protein
MNDCPHPRAIAPTASGVRSFARHYRQAKHAKYRKGPFFMRVLMIVAVGAVAALAFGASWIWPELSLPAPSGLSSLAARYWPVLAPGDVVVYASIALLAVALLVIGIARGRTRIVASGLIGTVLLSPLWIWRELSVASLPELPSIAARHLSELAAGAVLLYALIVLLLTTVLFVTTMARARARLAGVITRDQLLAAFTETGLERLASRILDLAPSEWPAFQNRIVLQSQFSFGRARREFAHLYRDRLARAHFFTALAVLLAIGALGWTQDYGHISIGGIALPPEPAFAAAMALAVFGILGRLTIDTAAELLLDRISGLPVERLDITLLRPMGARLERVGVGSALDPGPSPIAAIEPMLERFTQIIERGCRSLSEPVMQLSASAEAMTALTRELSGHSTNLAQGKTDAGMAREFKTAVERLTASIERLSVLVERIPASPVPALVQHNSRKLAALNGNLDQQMRELLKEFE